MANQNERREFLKYGVMGIATFVASIAPFKLSVEEDFAVSKGMKNFSIKESTASAECGASFNCSGGGGECGASFNCSGGGGQCGASFNCSGGGGQCGASFNCSGS